MSEKKEEKSLKDVSFEDDEDENIESVQKDFESAIDLAQKIREDVEAEIGDHVSKDEEDQCGYCGQCFGPDDVVVERTIYGRKWQFCDEQCLKDFQDASNFKDEDLDSEPDANVNVEHED